MADQLNDDQLIDEYYKRIKNRREAKANQSSAGAELLNWIVAIIAVAVLILLMRIAGVQ